ncbi:MULTISPECIES: HupE/UreJ family protein [unclassified Streptomyces]|uniref:HupE/UreJ family protein n=1 Tax=unclassified Streptomyces TaxID=2593676 RepID=UPI00081F6049|nr:MULTISPECIES: HupE/UreJ family protein [unclassified Streptomyces]MYZ34243.1 HupE/UreJ family protein [Streptomyces sp. SID4917]SCF65356.1 HupE / UreJ protein [Streptomyces sp. MnatMP-M17]
MSQPVRRALILITAAVIALLSAGPALAHGFTSVVYAHVTAGEEGHIRTKLELEYDLFVVSAADSEGDDPLFRTGNAAFEDGDTAAQAAALNAHATSAVSYATKRFSVTSGGKACTPAQSGDFTMGRREGVPYAGLLLDWACPEGGGDPEVRSGLFPDSETYVKGTKTIVTYEIDGRSGSAALDAEHPSFSMGQSWYERFWEFFRLGAEHLLGGIDHILFLLALIAGSRRLREIVLAATSFTLAHSVTFMLAALGVVDVPASVVEPVIALSIAVVAGWYLWRVWRRGGHAADLDLEEAAGRGHFSLDRAGWIRLGVVFCFGLVHGLGFAGALGIDEAWSWTLLWSLLVFNVGIEAVQLAIIALVFPLLTVLRHRAPTAGLWATGAISAGVSVMGLVWFVQRVFGL